MPESAVGQRLDRALAQHLDLPRNQIQHWLREGRVEVNGRPARAATSLAPGDVVTWRAPPPSAAGLEPEPGELRILFADDDLLVLDKPAGLVVHPGAGHRSGTLAHRLLDRFPQVAGVGGPGRPGIVHRLDQGTSGLLLIALTPLAYRRLTADFAARRIAKTYLGIVHGEPRPATGEIATPIGRHPVRRKEMSVRADGRPAVTRYTVAATRGGLALLAIDLATGRTHQIRVHLRSVGHPLVGDPTYGGTAWKTLPASRQAAARGFARPALHAWRLAFAHPTSGAPLALEAPPPADLVALWQALTDAEWPRELPPRRS